MSERKAIIDALLALSDKLEKLNWNDAALCLCAADLLNKVEPAGDAPIDLRAGHLPSKSAIDAFEQVYNKTHVSRTAQLYSGLSAAYDVDLRPYIKPKGKSFQERVADWGRAAFGEQMIVETSLSVKAERCHRFMEESLELVQAAGTTKEEVLQLVDYVYSRPVGELPQEIGGTLVCLAALCWKFGEDMDALGEQELARIWTKIDAIRAKRAAKPEFGPLPGKSPEKVDGKLNAEPPVAAQPNRSSVTSDILTDVCTNEILKNKANHINKEFGLSHSKTIELDKDTLAFCVKIARLYTHHALWQGLTPYGWTAEMETFGKKLAHRIADALDTRVTENKDKP
jgi:hypothetical protein